LVDNFTLNHVDHTPIAQGKAKANGKAGHIFPKASPF